MLTLDNGASQTGDGMIGILELLNEHDAMRFRQAGGKQSLCDESATRGANDDNVLI